MFIILFSFSLLGKIDWVATTADCWSAHNKSYLGMTVHWLDPITRARMHAVLACIRLKGHHTYDILAQAMIDIHYEFHIDKKITRSVYFLFFYFILKPCT